MNIKDILNDSFTLPSSEAGVQDLKLQSLKLGLKAYFSTYQSVYHGINYVTEGPSKDLKQAKIDSYFKRG